MKKMIMNKIQITFKEYGRSIKSAQTRFLHYMEIRKHE